MKKNGFLTVITLTLYLLLYGGPNYSEICADVSLNGDQEALSEHTEIKATTNREQATLSLSTLSLPPTEPSDITKRSLYEKPVVIKGEAFFCLYRKETGRELWKSDGTVKGTVMVKDIWPGVKGSDPSCFTVVNEVLFFSADDGINGRALWKSDGTPDGTKMLKKIRPNNRNLIAFNDILFLNASDNKHGPELWMSDGTVSGTLPVKDIYPGKTGSYPRNFIVAGDILFFKANDGLHGSELWKTDGTSHGTQLVKDICPGLQNNEIRPFNPKVLDKILYFEATDGIHGYELWRSDGTFNGTFMVKDINPENHNNSSIDPLNLTVLNDRLFFKASDGVHSQELWISNGTADGTIMVKDIWPGAYGGYPLFLTHGKASLFFFADDGIHGEELWKTDGSLSGTFLVKDIWPGKNGGLSWPNPLLGTIDHLFFFLANDGIHGRELWVSDGTPEGTKMVKDIDPGSISSDISSNNWSVVNQSIYFTAWDSTHGEELWKSDGTFEGTVMVKDIKPGKGGISPKNLNKILNTLFFTTFDGTNTHIWKSDGTEAGTIMLN